MLSENFGKDGDVKEVQKKVGYVKKFSSLKGAYVKMQCKLFTLSPLNYTYRTNVARNALLKMTHKSKYCRSCWLQKKFSNFRPTFCNKSNRIGTLRISGQGLPAAAAAAKKACQYVPLRFLGQNHWKNV